MTTLSYDTPEDAGMDPDRIAMLQERSPQWIDGFRARSAVMLAARRGKIFFHEAMGPLTDEADSPPVKKDTIFGVASTTKPVTATAIMMLIEDGKLGLNRPIKEYLPEMCGEGVDEVEVQHLLTHTCGFDDLEVEEKFQVRIAENGHLKGDSETGLHKFNARMLACHWDTSSQWAPGSKMLYCNFGYNLLGEIVRRVSGQSLDAFAAARIFEPLGMVDSSYIGDEQTRDRWVRRGVDVPGGSVSGDPIAGHEGIWMQVAPWGGSGLKTTALDLARFGQMFLNGGVANGKQVLSRACVHEMTRNQIPGVPAVLFDTSHVEGSWGLGWMIQGGERWRWSNSTLTPPGTFYHVGFGGHCLWVDPVNEIVGVFLSVCLDIDLEVNELHMQVDLFQNMVTAAVVY